MIMIGSDCLVGSWIVRLHSFVLREGEDQSPDSRDPLYESSTCVSQFKTFRQISDFQKSNFITLAKLETNLWSK